jgi:dihydroorotase
MENLNKISMIRPDDGHLHVRDGAAMASVIGATARVFERAIIMPNLKPPITTVAQGLDYKRRILSSLPGNTHFKPLMTLYLTDQTSPEEIEKLAQTEGFVGVKLYPAGATTNSNAGVTDLRKVWHVLETMQRCNVPLLIHGEVTTQTVDIFDREYMFIRHVLDPLLESFPSLKVVLEHITTREAVDFINNGEDRLAATITAHHLLWNRNSIFQGGIRPHFYCLPILKREDHRLALIEAAISGSPRFFLGTDSAPHAKHTKENSCGCAGMYTAPAALELYAEVFEENQALDKLEAFASFYMADFYGLPRNTQHITLIKQSWEMPATFEFGEEQVIPVRAGERIEWQLAA